MAWSIALLSRTAASHGIAPGDIGRRGSGAYAVHQRVPWRAQPRLRAGRPLLLQGDDVDRTTPVENGTSRLHHDPPHHVFCLFPTDNNV